MPQIIIRPGETVKVSGQYVIVSLTHNKPKQVSTYETNLTKGNITPPTPKGNQAFMLVDKTKHKK